jgi:hypothetical protein
LNIVRCVFFLQKSCVWGIEGSPSLYRRVYYSMMQENSIVFTLQMWLAFS